MDYEKEYKNLVAKVKNAHLYAQTDSTKNVLEDILPELRESEDERIRKALIDALKVSETIGELKFRLPYPTREECIAYLEKQKEPTTEELYAEAGTTEKEYIANTMKMVRAMRERKKEQKPISQEDFDTAKHEALWDEQKPAWSEEDTDMLNCCISSIEEAKENRYAYKETDGDTSYDREIAWLKSLRPQPREEIYQSAKHDLAIKFMNYLDENRPEGKMSLSNGECEDIDKAFKENDWVTIMRYVEKYRPSWKPSEEQMEALEVAFRKDGDDNYRNIINSLYNDLKRL